MAISSDTKDGKLWPSSIEKHFIDVLVEEEFKGNMPNRQFKKGLWIIIQNEFNQQAEKNCHKDQLRQKFQRLKQRHQVFFELISHSGMGWDSVTKTFTGIDEAWAHIAALFNIGTATRILQISSSQPAPNSDEEQELDAAFPMHGVHMNMEADSGDDVDELPTPVEGQGNKRAEKLPSHIASFARKKRKESPLAR
ncbi:l10-interacting myb domain-containing protein [Quercus suber]|uniref:L10-interacting myb domain-containing protein n=1 Tax=Quercus suber TaxID=58331 RepID=A0AAW0JF21_QUESU